MKDNIDSIVSSLIQLTKDFKLKWVGDEDRTFYNVKTDNYIYTVIIQEPETASENADIELRVYGDGGKRSTFVSSIYEKIIELNNVVYDFVHNGKERYDLARLTDKIVHEEYSSTKKRLYTRVESEAFIKELTEHLYENYSEDGWECDDEHTLFFRELNGCRLYLETKSGIATLTVLDEDGTIERQERSYPIIRKLYNKLILLTSNEIDVYDIICDLSELDKKEIIF